MDHRLRLTWLAASTLVWLASSADAGLLELLVPAYGNPCCGSGRALWQQMIEASSQGPLTAILNPNSGPGSTPIDSNYIRADGQTGPLLDLRRAGGRVVGYVHTAWAQRPLDEVKAEIDRYLAPDYWRGAAVQMDGIFLDEMSNDLAQVGYYQALREHVSQHAPAMLIMGNPGTTSTSDSSRGASGFTIHDYFHAVDTLVTFEDTGQRYRSAYVAPPGSIDRSPTRVGHLMHSEATLDAMLQDLTLARERGAEVVYVTDDVMNNPYDRPPSYWNELVDRLWPAVTIDQLARGIRSGSLDAQYDLNRDGRVDVDDHAFWVRQVWGTTAGDADLDGHFTTADLVQVFQAGGYEDGIPANAAWSTGDWNGSGDFDSEDLVLAWQTGGFELPRNPARMVPELTGSTAVTSAIWIAWWWWLYRR